MSFRKLGWGVSGVIAFLLSTGCGGLISGEVWQGVTYTAKFVKTECKSSECQTYQCFAGFEDCDLRTECDQDDLNTLTIYDPDAGEPTELWVCPGLELIDVTERSTATALAQNVLAQNVLAQNVLDRSPQYRVSTPKDELKAAMKKRNVTFDATRIQTVNIRRVPEERDSMVCWAKGRRSGTVEVVFDRRRNKVSLSRPVRELSCDVPRDLDLSIQRARR